MNMTTRVLLWDFGDTLVDERWMHHAPADRSEWPNAWAEVMRAYVEDWNTGRATERDIFVALSMRTGLDVESICATRRRAAGRSGSIRSRWRIANGTASAAGVGHGQPRPFR